MTQPQNNLQRRPVKLECGICDYTSQDENAFQQLGQERLCPYCYEAFLEQAARLNDGNSENCFKCEGPLVLSYSMEPHPSGEEVVNPNNRKSRRPRMRRRIDFYCRQNKCFKENVVKSWTGGIKHVWYAD